MIVSKANELKKNIKELECLKLSRGKTKELFVTLQRNASIS